MYINKNFVHQVRNQPRLPMKIVAFESAIQVFGQQRTAHPQPLAINQQCKCSILQKASWPSSEPKTLISRWISYQLSKQQSDPADVDSSWNVMAHGDARKGKWRGNCRMEWGASTLHTTSEYCVSSITTADAHTSAASSRLNWRHRRFKWTRPFRRKTKSGLFACAITFQLASTIRPVIRNKSQVSSTSFISYVDYIYVAHTAKYSSRIEPGVYKSIGSPEEEKKLTEEKG